MTAQRIFVSTSLLLGLALVFGCGGGEKLPQRYATSGKLLYNGRPPVGAVVTFWPLPVDSAKWQSQRPTSQIGEDGSFKLWTYTPEDGAIEGEYAVTLVWDRAGSGPGGADVFTGRFADPNKPVAKITIKPQANELPPIELTGPAVTPPRGES